MENKQNSESLRVSAIPQEYQDGVRRAQSTLVEASNQPQIPALPSHKTGIGVKGTTPEVQPSKFQNTNTPYLARVFEVTAQIIDKMGIRDSISEIDTFILDLVKERNWVDNDSSYQDVLQELYASLGLHRNLDVFMKIEKMVHGVRLLRLQNLHKRRDKEIQEELNKKVK